METEIFYACDTCKLETNCDFNNNGKDKELEGDCIGYKPDIDKVTKQQTKRFKNER